MPVLTSITATFHLTNDSNRQADTKIGIKIEKQGVLIARISNVAPGQCLESPGNHGPYDLQVLSQVEPKVYRGSTTTIKVEFDGQSEWVASTHIIATFSDGSEITSESGPRDFSRDAAVTTFQNQRNPRDHRTLIGYCLDKYKHYAWLVPIIVLLLSRASKLHIFPEGSMILKHLNPEIAVPAAQAFVIFVLMLLFPHPPGDIQDAPRALREARRFRTYWLWNWLSWLLLYIGFAAHGFMKTSPIYNEKLLGPWWDAGLSCLNNLSAIFIFACYLIL